MLPKLSSFYLSTFIVQMQREQQSVRDRTRLIMERESRTARSDVAPPPLLASCRLRLRPSLARWSRVRRRARGTNTQTDNPIPSCLVSWQRTSGTWACVSLPHQANTLPTFKSKLVSEKQTCSFFLFDALHRDACLVLTLGPCGCALFRTAGDITA